MSKYDAYQGLHAGCQFLCYMTIQLSNIGTFALFKIPLARESCILQE
jgi:hypothetical protein